MKSIKKNQRLTKEEKKEAQEFNEALFDQFDIRFKCQTIGNYYLIKCLYLLSQIPKDPEIEKTVKKVLNAYYNEVGLKLSEEKKERVIDRTLEDFYFNYGFTEGLYQYWLKYYYPTVLNFTSFLALYSGEMLDYGMFFNASKRSLDRFDKFIEEETIEMVRNEMTKIEEETYDEDDIVIYFVWRAKKDEKTCKICNKLDGKAFRWAPGLAHPNCRCHLEVIITEVENNE